jgi:hypothetical protein
MKLTTAQKKLTKAGYAKDPNGSLVSETGVWGYELWRDTTPEQGTSIKFAVDHGVVPSFSVDDARFARWGLGGPINNTADTENLAEAIRFSRGALRKYGKRRPYGNQR